MLPHASTNIKQQCLVPGAILSDVILSISSLHVLCNVSKNDQVSDHQPNLRPKDMLQERLVQPFFTFYELNTFSNYAILFSANYYIQDFNHFRYIYYIDYR